MKSLNSSVLPPPWAVNIQGPLVPGYLASDLHISPWQQSLAWVGQSKGRSRTWCLVWLVGIAYTLALAVSSEWPHGIFRVKDRCCKDAASRLAPDSTPDPPPESLRSGLPVTPVAKCSSRAL